MTATDETYVADIERRLAEAEAVLRAIREGEVDAVLVRDAQEDKVFHLGGGGESYRAFMEAMDLGAAAVADTGTLVYVNATLAQMLGHPADALVGRGLSEAFGGALPAGQLDELLHQARDARCGAQLTFDRDGRRRQLVIAASPLPLDFGQGWAVTVSDITERLEAVATEEFERIGRAVMASANEAVLVCDTAGHITHASSAALEILEGSPVGQSAVAALAVTLGPGAGPMGVEDIIDLGLQGSSLRAIEAALTVGMRVKDVTLSVSPVRSAGGVIRGCILTLVDLTERKALEQRQILLMRELDHRMKNMLALVQSISARTLATTETLAEFGERFSKRLAALAATQDMLAQKAWTSLSVEAIVAAELAPYLSSRNPRLDIRGLSADVTRDAAVALGLVFHELATNAVKYGSLSVEGGRLEVTGAPAGDGGLRITWRETSGPLVSPPTRKGFGQTVITRGLGFSAAAPTLIAYEPEGVVCEITLSRAALL